MKNFFLFLFSFLLISCSFQGKDFSGNLTSSAFVFPSVEVKKSEIIYNFAVGKNFVSFPFLSDSFLITKNAAIESIAQKEEVSEIKSSESYFLEVSKPFLVSWEIEETPYNSAFLQSGENYLAIYKGTEKLLASEITINGSSIFEAAQLGIIQSFQVMQTSGNFIDLAKNYHPDFVFPLGAGVKIQATTFAKISWTNSSVVQKIENSEAAKELKSQEKVKKSLEKEQQNSVKNIEKRLDKINEELLQSLFEELQVLPISFAQKIAGKDSKFLSSFIADKQLLAQVHSLLLINANKDALSADFWLQNTDLKRKFSVLTKKGFYVWNTVNRGVVLLQVPLTEKEIDVKTGIDSKFIALAFIRDKSCNWKLDPVQTSISQQLLESFAPIYDDKTLLTRLKTQTIQLEESEDFTNARLACIPETTSFLETKKGSFIDISATSVTDADSKLLKDHETHCENFSELLNDYHPEELQEIIYNDEKEPKISGASLPVFSYHESICKEFWPNLLGNIDFENILNEKADESVLETFSAWQEDPSLFLFLGTNKFFSCKKLEDTQKESWCNFGVAMSKTSSSQCKKINDELLQLECASFVAQKKKDPLQCEKVYGKYDKKADKDNLKKQVQLRNCQLDVSLLMHEDCKSFKKKFFFFFSFATETSKKCFEYAEANKKLSSYVPVEDEESVRMNLIGDSGQESTVEEN